MPLPQFQKVAERYLPRYSAPELTPVTLGLLAGEDLSARRAAVISLIHQNDASAETRARVAGLLADASPVMREAAGEYLLWHGTEAESESLQAAARKEADLHARASMLAAAAVIRRRAKRPAAKPPSGEKKNPPPPRSFADAWLLLRAHPSDAIRAQALDVYRRREEFEPRLRYAGGDPDAKLSRERTARMLLAAEIFAFPANARSRDASRPEDVPVAASFTAPVRDYFHPGRRSFGLHTAPGGRAFGNSVHVGDDVSWLKDQTTVVAIADGVVRRVNQVWTWGFIVIVEHRLPGEDAWCCSLYAHLSPAVCVAPGDVVRKGQKIGSTGRSLCWENGGYWSHLHFGLHDGPYLSSHPIGRKIDYTLSSGEEVVGVVTARGDPCATVTVTHKGESVSFEVAQSADWICGYVSKDFWKGEHGWLDPQKFIRERLDDTERPAVERRIRELGAESKKKKEDGKSAPAPEPGKKAA